MLDKGSALVMNISSSSMRFHYVPFMRYHLPSPYLYAMRHLQRHNPHLHLNHHRSHNSNHKRNNPTTPPRIYRSALLPIPTRRRLRLIIRLQRRGAKRLEPPTNRARMLRRALHALRVVAVRIPRLLPREIRIRVRISRVEDLAVRSFVDELQRCGGLVTFPDLIL